MSRPSLTQCVRACTLPRNVNTALAIAWAVMVPVAIVSHLIYSVAFISFVSIYANFVSHWAARQADMPNPEDRDGQSRMS